MYHFHTFCALVALGRYDEAKVKYNTIIESSLMSKSRLNRFAAKYVSDTLDAGLSWYPLEHKPEGTAFLAMYESADIYHQLATKARRIVPYGFHPTCSPDGTEVAYGRGTPSFAGIEIFNLKNEKTRLLTVPGFDPAWSPDGRYIAFTRDRKKLLLTEFTNERSRQTPTLIERDIWLIKADGTEEPRFMARGYWPSWSSDSMRIFYHSQLDNMLYSISIKENVKPVPIVQCTDIHPVVSPDGKYVAYYGQNGRIVELSTNSVVASLALPLGAGGGFVNWSPDGRELSIGGDGLWIYDLDTKTASKILSGHCTWCSWSRSEIRRLAITCGYQWSREVWVASLDPDVSTVEALGPGRTIEEHAQEKIDYYTRRIDTDPEDAEAYVARAECYVYFEEYEKATADFEELAILLESNPRLALPSWVNWLIKDLAAGGIEKYGTGSYEQALTILTIVDKFRRAIDTLQCPSTSSVGARKPNPLSKSCVECLRMAKTESF